MAAHQHQHRRASSLATEDRVGLRMTKRAMIIAGGGRSRGRAPPTTPVPSWKVFNNQLYDGMNKPPPPSARKLAASLWELQEFPLPACFSACLLHHHSPRRAHSHSHSHSHANSAAASPSSPEDNASRGGLLPAAPKKTGHRRGKTGSSRSHELEAAHLQKLLSRGDMESGGMVDKQRHRPCALFSGARNATNCDADDAPQQASITATMSQELVKVFSQIRVLEQQHNSSLTLTTALHTELVRAHARIRDLEHLVSRASAQQRVEALGKKRAQAVAAELEAERAARVRLEVASRQLTKEVVEAQAAAASAAHELERERKARELIEEVCHELAQETGEEKAQAAEMKRQSLQARDELDEERRMLQLAEVWREERVQMKLGEAKLALQEKTAALDVVKAQLDAFLTTRLLAASPDAAIFRDAQVLRNVIAAISEFPAGEYAAVAADTGADADADADTIAGGGHALCLAEGIPDAD